jgi:hypothetical protein
VLPDPIDCHFRLWHKKKTLFFNLKEKYVFKLYRREIKCSRPKNLSSYKTHSTLREYHVKMQMFNRIERRPMKSHSAVELNI